jgi:hypothetical protein
MMNYRGIHDIGGLPAGPVEATEHDYALWEKRVDAMLVLLSKKGLITDMSYYERWINSITQTLIQRGTISIDELGRKIAEVQARGND